MRIEAIYTRQSVDRADSISVESQAEYCKKELTGNRYRIYTDKGYSGKNTDRPAFQQMMQDVAAGRIERVIVYRLDRISRSVLDFANVIDVFQTHAVSFSSTMEKFDTASPIGKAMLMIVMIFAQLERETIQQRVIDAYASRSRRGFYMGGRVPYGFALRQITIDGVRTHCYAPLGRESAVIRQIFSLYAQPQASLGDVAAYLSAHNIKNRSGAPFSRSRIRDLIVNPIYVRADPRIYHFFQAQGTEIVNSPADFIGVNGAYLYSGDADKRRTASLSGHTLVLAPHEGIVDAGTWILCRTKCLHHQSAAKPMKAQRTWLAGKLKCGCCGYALTVKVGRRKRQADVRYYLCSHKYASKGGCTFGSLRADTVDALVFEEICAKLREFPTLSPAPPVSGRSACRLQAQMDAVDSELQALVRQVPQADAGLMRYINRQITALEAQKEALCTRLSALERQAQADAPEITGYLQNWDRLTTGDKAAVADCLIESIRATETELQIIWRI